MRENKQFIKETTGPVLYPPLRDDLSERAAACRAATEDGACLHRHDRRRLPLGRELGAGAAAVFRAVAGLREKPTLKRSNAHDIVAEECKAVREGVGLLDISGFSASRCRGRTRKLARPADGLEAARTPAGRGLRRCCRRKASSRAI
jgi:hypothetical protein